MSIDGIGSVSIDGDKYKANADGIGNVTVEGDKYGVSGDGYSATVEMGKEGGGDKLTSEMKFDKYFAYGIDQMGTQGGSGPQCGPNSNDCGNKMKS